ncbi:MAG: hypothetical protein V5A72_02305, partial [Candidatus Nanohaloarchaea archaeon]
VAKKLGISKQKPHYHFKKLKESDLIEKIDSEEIDGGKAGIYTSKHSRLIYGDKPAKSNLLQKSFEDDGGLIVVGSPDQHGEDQVRARDGHLAGDVGLKLGMHRLGFETVWDTEVFRDSLFDENMVIIGGILTNTVTKNFNSDFPAYFSGESFPYREISTPDNTYSDPNIGVISRKENKILVAGIRNTGTQAAVKAFKEEDFKKDYLVVKGLDLDGDGEIDDYEVIE